MSDECFWNPALPAERHDDPAVRAAHFDPYDEELTRGRFSRVAAELGKCPVVHSDRYESGFFSVAGYRALEQVMKNPEIFSSFPGTLPPFGNERPMLPGELDPPDHAKYRRILTEFFSRRAQEERAETYRGFAKDCLKNLPADGSCDIVDVVCGPLPLRAMAHVLGVPDADIPLMERLGHALIRKTDEGGPEATAAELTAYFKRQLPMYRDHPTDNVMSALCRAEVDGRLLSDEEILDYCVGLVPAGFETTASTLSYIFLFLAEFPQLQERLRSDPDAIPRAIEECLRYATPVRVLARTVIAESTVDSHQFQPGDRVHLNFTGANHDASAFNQPDEIDIDRRPNRHVSFGQGPHLCLGIHMARTIMRVALEESLQCMGRIRLADPAAVVETPGTTWAITRLPIAFDPLPGPGAVSHL